MRKKEIYVKEIQELTGMTIDEIKEKVKERRESYKCTISDEGVLFVMLKGLLVKRGKIK